MSIAAECFSAYLTIDVSGAAPHIHVHSLKEDAMANRMHPSEHDRAPAQIDRFQREARNLAGEQSAARFEAALKALVSPERTFRPLKRKTARTKERAPSLRTFDD